VAKEGKSMTKEHIPSEEKALTRKPEHTEPDKRHASDPRVETPGLVNLQQLIGNRAVQRLLAQHSGA
jgi:hypothetical protein